MEQRIRFCEVEGHRIAWASVGSGPPLVMPAPWVGNPHAEWEDPEHRRFIEALAAEHTVIRYDRPGTGLSDRTLPKRLSLDYDIRMLEGVVEAADLGPASLFGVSCGGCISLGYAARNPKAVTAMVFSGCYIEGHRLAPAAVQDSLVSVIRASWGLGARMLSDLFVPGGSQAEREDWARFQHESADAEAAAVLYDLIYDYDASAAVGQAGAPALVLHRRDDKAVGFELGRELAASLPHARFVPLEGMRHLPWQGDSESLLAEALEFLAEEGGAPATTSATVVRDGATPGPEHSEAPGPSDALSPPGLSRRELEVCDS